MNEKFINSKVYLALRALLNIGFLIGVVVFLFYLCMMVVSIFIDGTNPITNAISPNLDGFILEQTVPPKTGAGNVFYFFTGLSAVFVSFLCVWMLRNIVNSLSDATPFTQKNVNRIRIMGWTLLVQVYLKQLMYYLYAQQLSDAYQQSGTPSLIQPHFTLLPDGVFFALCVVVLAEVFRYGCTLQNEHDTTV